MEAFGQKTDVEVSSDLSVLRSPKHEVGYRESEIELKIS